jgi:hypothetical protein
MIKGGYILQPRVFGESDASKMPPVTREIWMYILRKVNHSDSKQFKRGQGFFRFSDIQNDLCWYAGYRKIMYSKPQITKSLRRLCEGNMTATMKATRGIVITVCNYDHYQNPKNYEGNDEKITKEPRRKRSGRTINKNGEELKNSKNGKNIPINKPKDNNMGGDKTPATFQGNGGVQNHAEILYVVDQFYQHRIATNPIAFKTFDKEKSYSQSILELDKLIRIDKYTLDEIKSVLNFAVNDSFWQDQVYSLARLRRKSGNGETKFKNIYLKFKASTKQQDAMDAWAAEMEEK